MTNLIIQMKIKTIQGKQEPTLWHTVDSKQ